jgi:DNA-binding CsgD family transcriptional regulator
MSGWVGNMIIQDLQQYRKQYFNVASQYMRELITPLKPFGIKLFGYSNVTCDQSREFLTTDVEAALHFYEIGSYKELFCAGVDDYTNSAVLWRDLGWDTNDEPVYFRNLRNDFDLDNGIVITKKFQDEVRFYYFGGSRDAHHLNTFYLNNLDLLYAFIDYFHDTGETLLKKVQKNTFKILDGCNDLSSLAKNQQDILPIHSNVSSATSKFDRFLVRKLTQRELMCLYCLSSGKTIKETGEALQITPRTVKAHIRNIKDKLGCVNQFQLGIAYRKLNKYSRFGGGQK